MPLISTLNSEYGYIENKLNIEMANGRNFLVYETTGEPISFDGLDAENDTNYGWVYIKSMFNPEIFSSDSASAKDTVPAFFYYLNDNNEEKTKGKYQGGGSWNGYNYRDIEAVEGRDNVYKIKLTVSGDTTQVITKVCLSTTSTQKIQLLRSSGTGITSIAQIAPGENYRDTMIEQGEEYSYSVAPVNTTPTELTRYNTVTADFEDIFLSDSERSLRVRFNPKVSSFKTNFQEQKIETLGGQFPFFVRNGKLKYREFPISGLISYEMDEQFLFVPGAASTRASTPDTSITLSKTGAQRVHDERKFKLAVQEWLSNGEPKVFRSPTEGNYIVRLMNVSLSPDDKLSRMLHTFSATAYEVDEYNLDSLKKHNVWPEYAEIHNIETIYILDSGDSEAPI